MFSQLKNSKINIFAYGTLMFKPVWLNIAGSSCVRQGATLHGYKRTSVKGQIYPALIPTVQKDKIDGIVYLDVSNHVVNRLDVFEGPLYVRQKVNISLPDNRFVSAEVYILKKEYFHIIDSKDWDEKIFESEYMSLFLNLVS